MTFGAMSGKYLQLRQRLSVHVGSDALADITIPPPSGSDDELSFIRLVGWVYVLLQETGRIPLNFLKELPPMSISGKLLPEVERLRTWTSHNLYLSKNQDLNTLRIAQAWFRHRCGAGTPSTPTQWRACFTKLCEEALTVLTGAISACDVLDSEVDGPRLVNDLQMRLNRNWEAFRFDTYIQKAVAHLGFPGINVVSFRKQHLDGWRKLVATTEDTAIDQLLTLRIEADVLKLMSDALPATAQDILMRLEFDGPTEVAAAMLVIKTQRKLDSRNLPTLLQALFADVTERRRAGSGPDADVDSTPGSGRHASLGEGNSSAQG